MVKSKLNDQISYHEYSHLEEEDFNYNSPLFNLKIKGITVIIGVGHLNYKYSKRYRVVYMPIYLFNANYEFMKQIGVYEMLTDSVVMDESGDVDIHKLTPMFYGFLSVELLRRSLATPSSDKGVNGAGAVSANDSKKKKKEIEDIKKSLGKQVEKPLIMPGSVPTDVDVDTDSDNDDNNNNNNRSDTLFGLDSKQKHVLSGATILPLQTKEQSELERKQYKNNIGDLWIQKYLRNKYFSVMDNEGGSDSFFAVIRDALLTQGRRTTILELRKQLADEVSDEVFKKFREKYVMYNGILKTQNRESKEKITAYNEYKQRISSVHDRAQQQLMIAGAKKLAIEHNMKIDEIKYSKVLSSQYDYMKEVRTPEQLKERIQTSLYWPDAWALYTMERVLNIKFVLFSSSAYDTGDIENVIQCGSVDTIDPLFLKKSSFEPTAYIMIDQGTPFKHDRSGGGRSESARQRNSHSNTHTRTSSSSSKPASISFMSTQRIYKLITYKTHGVLAFSEVPYDVKLLITTKCLETNAGAFCLIPQFKLFQKELGIRSDIGVGYGIGHKGIEDILEEVHMDAHGNGTTNRSGAHLYSPDIVFQFYNKSNPNTLPGMGSGEKIPEEDKIHFQKLASFDNWRRKLSNFWQEPFMLDNHTWQSVEHYYQACKFKNNNREFYLKFSLDSRSELANDPIIAKAAGSKSGKLNHSSIIRPSSITIDPDFFSHGRGERVMEEALFAKFSQNRVLKDILLATRNAKLVQYLRGSPPIVFHNLMRVRHKLLTKQ